MLIISMKKYEENFIIIKYEENFIIRSRIVIIFNNIEREEEECVRGY